MRKLQNKKDSFSLNFGDRSIYCFMIIFGSVVTLNFAFYLIWQDELFFIKSLRFSFYSGLLLIPNLLIPRLFVFLLPIPPLHFILYSYFSFPIPFMILLMIFYFTFHLLHPLLKYPFQFFIIFPYVMFCLWFLEMGANFDENHE